MSNKTLLLVTAVITLTAGLWAAWEYWPPLLGYRANRALAGARDEVRKYLTGTQSLDTSARRLAIRLEVAAAKRSRTPRSKTWPWNPRG